MAKLSIDEVVDLIRHGTGPALEQGASEVEAVSLPTKSAPVLKAAGRTPTPKLPPAVVPKPRAPGTT